MVMAGKGAGDFLLIRGRSLGKDEAKMTGLQEPRDLERLISIGGLRQ